MMKSSGFFCFLFVISNVFAQTRQIDSLERSLKSVWQRTTGKKFFVTSEKGEYFSCTPQSEVKRLKALMNGISSRNNGMTAEYECGWRCGDIYFFGTMGQRI